MGTGWENTLIAPDASMRSAIETINNDSHQICLVVDDNRRLLGTITDGDVRRALIAGGDMATPVDRIMHAAPLTAAPDTARDELLGIATREALRQIPLCTADGTVVGLVHVNEMTSPAPLHDNWVLLMAGGLGSRLHPLTEKVPKPMLSVGDKPLLETILENFIGQNFHRFYLSVNYRAEAIKDHFGDGSRWGVEIKYLEEKNRLGTAGALQLLPERPNAPLIVMNGDLLTRVNFHHLLEFHAMQGARATMCVREYDFQVPFGVVQIDDNRISGIDEKPMHRFFVNAGIYSLDPDVLDCVPRDRMFDMTQLFEKIVGEDIPTAAFPIHEYWLDIGRLNDLDRAKMEFDENFNT